MVGAWVASVAAARVGIVAGRRLRHRRRLRAGGRSGPLVAPQPAPVQQGLAPAPPIVVPPPRVRTSRPRPRPTELGTALDAWLVSAYKRCWKAKTTTPDSEPYFPKIRVAFKTDGALAAPPRLVNPPSDPAWKPQADAALRAVKACDPLHVPDKFAPYYRQWKTKTVYFDPRGPDPHLLESFLSMCIGVD